MVLPLMTLGVAAVAYLLSLKIEEEIVKVAMMVGAIIAGLIAVVFAPWIFKLVILAVPMLVQWGLERN